MTARDYMDMSWKVVKMGHMGQMHNKYPVIAWIIYK